MKTKGRLINHHKAKKFQDRITDSIVQGLIGYAYSQIFMEHLEDELEGDFDVYFLFRVLEALMRDRERLARALLGESQNENTERP